MSSLRARIAAGCAIIAVLAVSVLGVLSYTSARSVLQEEVDRMLVGAAEGAGGPVGLGPRPNRQNPAALVVVQHLDGAGQRTRPPANPGGDLQPVLPASPTTLPVDATDIVLASSSETSFRSRTAILEGSRWRIVTMSRGGGRGAVQAGREIEEIASALDRIGARTASTALAAALGAAVAGWFLAGFALRRLRTVNEAARHITQTGDLSGRVEAGGGDELAMLADSFNKMLDSLQHARDSERRLMEDAGHELRTPLTSLQANAALLDRLELLPPKERQALIRDLRTELDELSALVEQTLALSAPYSFRRFEELDVVELVRDVTSRHNTLTLLMRGVRSAWIEHGDRALLTRAIRNLVDNAEKFAPGSPVEFSVTVSNGMVDLTVTDRGPGLEPGTESSVFERFWRAPSSREVQGSGLGLSIVAEVARLHGGTVHAANRDGGGAEIGFTIRALGPER